MKKTILVSLMVLSIAFIGCQNSTTPTTPATTTTAPQAMTDSSTPSISAKDLLNKFFEPNADFKKLTADLKPTSADYAAYFDTSVAAEAEKNYDTLWNNSPAFQPQAGQTELLLYKATTEEIKNKTGEGADFPGGYADVIDKIKPNQTIYHFKFVKPGETLGMAFDGLVYINSHWVLFPKPWKTITK